MFFLLLFLISSVSGVSTTFFLKIHYPDSHVDQSRRLIIDIACSNGFLMDANAFPDLIYDITVNTSESKTFKDLGIGFANNYTYPYNEKESGIYGRVGQDLLKLKKLQFNATFGVVDRIRGEPNEGIYGVYGVGRVGFSRNNRTATPLRDSILEVVKEKKLCLSARVRKDGRLRSTLAALGKVPFPESDLLLKTKSEENLGDLWQLNVTNIKTGRYSSSFVIPAAFSSVLNGIAAPERVVLPVIRALGAKYERHRKQYIFPCKQEIKPIYLSLNGKEVRLDRYSFTEQVNEEDCQVKFVITNQDRIILGSSIFINRAICLDYQKDEISVYGVKDNIRRNGDDFGDQVEQDEETLIFINKEN